MLSALRAVHRVVGFALTASLLLYAASGLMLQHGWPERGEPRRATRTVAIDPTAADADRETVADRLRACCGIAGRLDAAKREDDGSLRFVFRRPGCESIATIAPARDLVAVVERRGDAVATLGDLHRLRGGTGALDLAWVVLYDAVAVAMLVFAVTGVALWHATCRRRWPGWVLLGAVTGFTLAVACDLAWAA